MASDTASLQNTRSAAQKKLQQFLGFLKRHLPGILSVLSIVMLVLAGVLVYLLITQTFEHEFSCAYMIDRTLLGYEPAKGEFSFCTGVSFTIPGLTLIKETEIGPITIPYIGFHDIEITILPGLKPIDKPLKKARLFVAWNIVIAFAVISVVLTFIAVRVKAFVQALMEPQGRRKILVNISIYLVIFAVISGLFYFSVVANH